MAMPKGSCKANSEYTQDFHGCLWGLLTLARSLQPETMTALVTWTKGLF